MALRGNYSVLNRTCGRFIAGPTISCNRSNFNTSGENRNKFLSMAKFMSVPNGTSPPYSWVIPQQSGGMAASVGRITGTGLVTNAAVAQGVGASAALSGSGTISSGNLALIISLACTLAGTGTISSANLALIQQLAASLSGTGTISSANMALIVDVIASLSGSGALTAAAINKAIMTADITPFTTLSPESLAASLWGSIAASYNSAGTMGEKLNSAGGGSSAADIADAVWARATRTLTDNPGPTSLAIAAQVRAELEIELGRIDAAISSRLATAGYTAPANADIAAIKNNTDLIPGAL